VPTELTDPDDDGILEFTQTAEDVDGDSLSISLELDQVNGTPQNGSDRNPQWLSYSTSEDTSGGTTDVDIDVVVNASELGGAGTTYTFFLEADDGVSTVSCQFSLEVTSPGPSDLIVATTDSPMVLSSYDAEDGAVKEDPWNSGFDNNDVFVGGKGEFIGIVDPDGNGQRVISYALDGSKNWEIPRSDFNNGPGIGGYRQISLGGPDNDMLAFSDFNYLWAIEPSTQKILVNGISVPHCVSLDVKPDERVIAVADDNNYKIYTYDENGNKINEGGIDKPTDIVYDPNGSYVIYGNDFNFEIGRVSADLSSNTSAYLSPNDGGDYDVDVLEAAEVDGTRRLGYMSNQTGIHDLSDKSEIWSVNAHNSPKYLLMFDGGKVYGGWGNEVYEAYDKTGTNLFTIYPSTSAFALGVAFK